MEPLLFLMVCSPPVGSLLILVWVWVDLFRRRREQAISPFVWPALVGATVLPLLVYPLLFAGIKHNALVGAMSLIWIAAGLFCITGVMQPPPPSRRWMFVVGLAEIALGLLFMWMLRLIVSSFAMH